MTDSGFDNIMINSSRLNRSFSQIFQAPLLPHFGSKTIEEEPVPDEEDTMEKRLAKHLPKSRSSRKQRASKSTDKSKGVAGPNGITGESSEDRSSGTCDTSPNSSSSSSIMMEDSDKSQTNAFQTVRHAESKKVKSSRPTSPKQAGKPKAPLLRRTKSLEGVALMSDRKQVSCPKTRKSSRMSDRSAPNNTRSPRRNADGFRKSDSTKTMDSTSKKLRRNTTKSGMSKAKPERRSALREYSSELLQSMSPVNTKERRGSAKSSSKERRDSGKSNSDIAPKRKSPAHAEPTPSTATTVTTPTCIHIGHWSCDCGSVLRDRMNFCGLCGTPKHWTCEDCQFGENLCQFVFCGDCGVPRDDNGSSNSFPRVVSVYDKVEQD